MIERPEVINGATYKIKPPIIDEAVYITINDAKIDGAIRPIEIFINSKNMKNFPWISCVTRLLSAQLRQGGEFPSFVIDELLDTYDPSGGYFIPKTSIKVNSIVAHIGYVLKTHCENLGLLNNQPSLELNK